MSALAGIKVLDFSRVLAGPWCGMTLADLGAEVIKIEPLDGDDTRGYGPPFLDDAGDDVASADVTNDDVASVAHRDHATAPERGLSAYFAACNRNKRSIAMDLRHPDNRPLLDAMIRDADVLIVNFRNSVAERLGIGEQDARALSPRLIYCAISGYGRDGPDANRPGYDFAIQAESGLMAITGPSDGMPSKVGVATADITTGLNATIAILAALYRRDARRDADRDVRRDAGRDAGGDASERNGQRIDISLFDAQLQALANVASSALFTGADAQRYGNAHPSIVPYQTFDANDGAFALAVASDRLWQRLCDLLDAPAWRDDPRCATNAARVQHRDWLIPKLAACFVVSPKSEWLARFEAAGIPAAPVNGVRDAVFGDLATARGLRIDAEGVPMIASPLRLSATPVRDYRRPPRLGEHADAICTAYGFDANALRKAGAIR
jgi:crotonobetainyl-CoA:carnitine CoA-transferase CaiB-like acyl-CoA transferase